MKRLRLDPEEQLAYELAISWRKPDLHVVPVSFDWVRFANLMCANRMAVLAGEALRRGNLSIPEGARTILDAQVDKYKQLAALFRGPLTTYLESAARNNIPTTVLKGLWLCEKVYENPAMRPGADIDILVPRAQVDACMALLKEQGIGEYWPNLLNDEYFSRHHLHQQRSSPDLKVWFEIHWALDHPYTLLTVDYAGIFQRAHRAELLGAPVLEMSRPDLILSLAIHIVKHAVYLPSLLDDPRLPRIVLADGMLMSYLDVAEVIKQFNSSIDWPTCAQLARAWGATESLRSVLKVCSRFLEAPIPADMLAGLPTAHVFPITQKLMGRAAEQQLDTYEHRAPNRFWQLLLASNGAFILRPIRLLETLSYFFPPADFLERRYGRANLLVRTRHLATAGWQSARFSVDAWYFALERYVRLKRMGKSASLFNRLDADL